MRTIVMRMLGVAALLVPLIQGGCAGEEEILDEGAPGEEAVALHDELDGPPSLEWVANMFANTAVDGYLCGQLGGKWVIASDRCILRGFRIGWWPNATSGECVDHGGYWYGSVCWFSSAWHPDVPVNYGSSQKITFAGFPRQSPVCIPTYNQVKADQVCDLVDGTIVADPQLCGWDTPYKCVFTDGPLNATAADLDNVEQSNCEAIGGIWTPPLVPYGTNPWCWSAGWRPGRAYLADPWASEAQACLDWGGSYNSLDVCWHRAPYDLAPPIQP